jgi:hypothetical protein
MWEAGTLEEGSEVLAGAGRMDLYLARACFVWDDSRRVDDCGERDLPTREGCGVGEARARLVVFAGSSEQTECGLGGPRVETEADLEVEESDGEEHGSYFERGRVLKGWTEATGHEVDPLCGAKCV